MYVMIIELLFVVLFGLLVWYLCEFIYKSFEHRHLVYPVFLNIQMYVLTAIFIYILLNISIYLGLKIFLMIIFPTVIEYVTGYLYFKINKKRLWDYSNEWGNYRGIICPLFSFYRFVITILSYFFILPWLLNIL